MEPLMEPFSHYSNDTFAKRDNILEMSSDSSFMSRKDRRICGVCGDRANGNYYGALCCEGCKIFFRRSILCDTHRSYACKGFDNRCDVVKNRNFCKLCRFNRCKRIGMNDLSVSQTPRSRRTTHNSALAVTALTQQCPQLSSQSPQSYCLNFRTIAPNYGLNQKESTNASSSGMPSTAADAQSNPIEDVANHVDSPQINQIKDVYRRTLGQHSDHIDAQQLFVTHLAPNQKVRDKYAPHYDEVVAFALNLNITSSLPQKEMEANLKNWLDVLLLRSCWWLAMKRPDANDQVIRVSSHYGLERGHNKQLEPLFSFGQTIKEMNLTETELALASAYILLCGHFSCDSNEQNESSQRRADVLSLLSSYQKWVFPNDKMRFSSLLINLSELAYVSGMA